MLNRKKSPQKFRRFDTDADKEEVQKRWWCPISCFWRRWH